MKIMITMLLLVLPLLSYSSVKEDLKLDLMSSDDHLLIYLINESDKSLSLYMPKVRLGGAGNLRCILWDSNGRELKQDKVSVYGREELENHTVILEPLQFVGIKLPMHILQVQTGAIDKKYYDIQCKYSSSVLMNSNSQESALVYSRKINFKMNTTSFLNFFEKATGGKYPAN